MSAGETVRHLASRLVPVSSMRDRRPDDSIEWAKQFDPDYHLFLELCDGGYTPDNLYHFFGVCGPTGHNVQSWNRPELWKANYGMGDEHFVFAENVLGNQYSFYFTPRRRVIKVLSVDVRGFSPIADSFAAFAERVTNAPSEPNRILREILEQFEACSGESYRPFHHLSPKVPACLGGGKRVEDLELTDSITDLQVTGQVLLQVKDPPPQRRG
jgi:hypothetical protein